jgi:hypothetical protein
VGGDLQHVRQFRIRETEGGVLTEREPKGAREEAWRR